MSCVVIVLAMVLCAMPAHAAKRALVIGNDIYVHEVWPDLTRARADAKAVGAALERADFSVTLREDRDRGEMLDDLRAFIRQVKKGDEVVLFFSGHGLRLDGRNYLVPTDARGDSREHGRDDAVSLSAQLDALRERDPSISLVIIDACRNDPFPNLGRKGMLPGLASMSGLRGQLIMYAAGAGQIALDSLSNSDPDPNSVFTRVLLREMGQQTGSIQSMAQKVRREVFALAQQLNHEQWPAIYDETLPNANMVVAPDGGVAPPPTEGTGRLAQLEAWSAWQSRMQSDFGRIAALSGAKLQAAGWRDFLSSYAQDNPFSEEDERLRSEAGDRLARVQGHGSGGYKDGDVFKDCGDCPEMVVIPAGRFEMGSPPWEPGREEVEGPQHWVTISRSFALSKYEVTQGEWRSVMGPNPSEFTSCGDTCPVEQVTWDDVQEFIRRLSAKTGEQYRLPSEAEWEYAARAGSRTRYPWGDEASHEYANYGTDDCCNGFAQGRDRWKNTAPVGQFAANGFGLYDMIGNVWEWVQDCWNESYAGAPDDGSAWERVDCKYRVRRGGSWEYSPQHARSAHRYMYLLASRYSNTGIRLARTLR